MNILQEDCSVEEHDGNDKGASVRPLDWTGYSRTDLDRSSLNPDEVKADAKAATAIQTPPQFEDYSTPSSHPKNELKPEGLAEDDSEHSGISPTAQRGPDSTIPEYPESQLEVGCLSMSSDGRLFYTGKNNVPHKTPMPPVPSMDLEGGFSYRNADDRVVPHDDEGDFLEELKSGLRREVPYAFVQWNLMVQVEKHLEEYYILYDPKSDRFYDFDTIPSLQSRDKIVEQFGIKVVDYPREQVQSKNIDSQRQADSRGLNLQNAVLTIPAQEQPQLELDSVLCCHDPDYRLECSQEQALTDHTRKFHPGIKPYKCRTRSHLIDTVEERNKHKRINSPKLVCRGSGSGYFSERVTERHGAVACGCFDENETDHDEPEGHPQLSAYENPSYERAFGSARHLKREREQDQGRKTPSRSKRRRTNMDSLHAPSLVVCSPKCKSDPYLRDHNQEGKNKILETKNSQELTKQSPWHCHGGECARNYEIEASLLRHMKKHHAGIKRFQCRGCSELFSTARERKNHVKQCHMSDSMEFWVCWLCGKSCSDETGQIEHLQSHEYVHCNGCGQNLSKGVSKTHKIVGCR